MRLILYSLIVVSWTANAFNGNNSSNITVSYDIDYFSATNTNISFYDDCSLSFELYIIGINKLNDILSTNIILQKSILYWLHSHIFFLIDTSFIYETDKYTNNLWHEYYLHLINISTPLILSIDICVKQTEIKQIIQTELNSDGDEIAAFLRYKLADHIQTNYTDINTDNLYINMMLDGGVIHTTDTKTDIPVNNSYVFTEKMVYVGIIGTCLIIMALIIMVCVVIFIKHKTEQRFQEALKDIKSQQNAKKSEEITDMDGAVISIEPINTNIPSHLMSIDHGLNTVNVLSDDDGNDPIKLSRNKLALAFMPEMNKQQMGDLAKHIDTKSHKSMQSLSAKESIRMNKHTNYNRNNSKSMHIIMPNRKKRKKKKKNRNKHPKKERHSVTVNPLARQQYAKRKSMPNNKRSQSKPNLRGKHKRNKYKYNRAKLQATHSDHIRGSQVNIAHNVALSLHSRSMHNLSRIPMENAQSLSTQSLHVRKIKVPQPNAHIHPYQPNAITYEWDSEPSKSSSHGIIGGVSTTKDAPLPILDDRSNSDAHSVEINKYSSISTVENENEQNKNVNVYKVMQSDEERVTLTQKIPPNGQQIAIPPPPPPPPPPQLISIHINPMNSISPIQRVKGDENHEMYEDGANNNERYDNKQDNDALSVIAVHTNVSLPYEPNV